MLNGRSNDTFDLMSYGVFYFYAGGPTATFSVKNDQQIKGPFVILTYYNSLVDSHTTSTIQNV